MFSNLHYFSPSKSIHFRREFRPMMLMFSLTENSYCIACILHSTTKKWAKRNNFQKSFFPPFLFTWINYSRISILTWMHYSDISLDDVYKVPPWKMSSSNKNEHRSEYRERNEENRTNEKANNEAIVKICGRTREGVIM